MTLKLAQGWQVMLADLSLILFLTTAASLASQDRPAPGTADAVRPALAGESVPAGVFRAGGETRLGDWLAKRATDPRESLTIHARYAPGAREAAIARAAELAAQAAAAGHEARIIVEPGARDEALALFAFTGETPMAQDLQ